MRINIPTQETSAIRNSSVAVVVRSFEGGSVSDAAAQQYGLRSISCVLDGPAVAKGGTERGRRQCGQRRKADLLPAQGSLLGCC